ncbi:MAG TPA: S26 family signal peptidase, partial [Chloroflexia bacterium]|nr:S26 family signal peptidase [Chloroflexia bacterium]
MKIDVEPNIEQDPSWHQEPGALPTGEGDTFSVHEVHFGGRPVVREILETVILTLLVFLGVRMIVQNFMVEGTSMEPTLHNAQYLLVNKASYARWDPGFLARLNPFQEGEPPAATLTYVLGGPQRGDIVVF